MNATITVAAVYKFGMLVAIMVPLSICPFMRYPTIAAVSDLDRLMLSCGWLPKPTS